ncbi:MAG: aspartate aminotransferase family protein [Clostridia bacterium]|nr:aspartate aminotransferase family protein [Clostridia bacterium]
MLKESLPKVITELPGPKSKKIIEKRLAETATAVACGTPAAIERAEGCMIQDVDGNIFLDFVAGIGVMNVGYSNPKIVKAAQDQLALYAHPQANCIHYKELGDLAERINKIVPGDFKKRTFFCNAGAEAVENAVKIARKFTGKKGVITFTNAYHGRTIFTMAMNATVKPYGKGFMGSTDGIYRAEFPDMYRLPKGVTEEEAVQYYVGKLETMLKTYVDPDDVACFILEPVQGEGGFTVFPIEFIKELRRICDENNILLIADEIQSGWCRTGRTLTCDYWAEIGVYADIVTTAKSVAAGLPLALVTAREEILECCAVGELGGTYGGNPVAIASAMAALDVMEEENMSARALEINKICMDRLGKMADKSGIIGNIRGLGAMIGIEFVKDLETKEHDKEAVDFILKDCVQNGLILKSAGYMGNTIRLLMPLVISDEQLNAGFDIMEAAINKYLNA